MLVVFFLDYFTWSGFDTTVVICASKNITRRDPTTGDFYSESSNAFWVTGDRLYLEENNDSERE
jgi:hypothetical protein